MEKQQFTENKSIATMHHMEVVHFPCPKCGKEAEADTSLVLTSYPAQYGYHCPHCGAHGSILCSEVDSYRFKEDVLGIIRGQALYKTRCIICDEEAQFVGNIDQPYVCPKCKKAVLKMRKLLEEDDSDR